MSGWRGMFAGALALIALESVLSSSASASRTATGFAAVASLVQRAISPGIALVPDIRPAATASIVSPGGFTSTSPATPSVPKQTISV